MTCSPRRTVAGWLCGPRNYGTNRLKAVAIVLCGLLALALPTHAKNGKGPKPPARLQWVDSGILHCAIECLLSPKASINGEGPRGSTQQWPIPSKRSSRIERPTHPMTAREHIFKTAHSTPILLYVARTWAVGAFFQCSLCVLPVA